MSFDILKKIDYMLGQIRFIRHRGTSNVSYDSMCGDSLYKTTKLMLIITSKIPHHSLPYQLRYNEYKSLLYGESS